MKEGWEKKPLLSFAEVCTGKHDANYATLNGKYRFYTCAYEYMWCDNYRFDEECLILPGNGANVGEVFYYNGPFDAYQRTYVVYKIRDILPKSLYYHFLYNWKTVGVSAQYGAATNYIKIGNFIDYKVNIPPLYEQSRIVEELDQLSNIIEKKRQQLSELDNLAQSIFYDMFGDPIKASYTKMPLKELAENIGDGLHGTPNYSDDGDCYFINGNNLEDGKIVVSNSTKKVDKKEKDKYFIELNTKTILVSINGTLGKIAYYNNENVILGKSACYIKLKEGINKVYIYNILCSDYFKRYAQDNATGSTIRNVSLKSMRNLLIPIPPLEKQDDYMNKIEAIEKEKELIKQSIKETEELFNSRMDYYFG